MQWTSGPAMQASEGTTPAQYLFFSQNLNNYRPYDVYLEVFALYNVIVKL